MCPFQKQADELLAVCCSGKFYESLMTDSIGRDDVKRNTFREVYFGRGPWRGQLGNNMISAVPGSTTPTETIILPVILTQTQQLNRSVPA